MHDPDAPYLLVRVHPNSAMGATTSYSTPLFCTLYMNRIFNEGRMAYEGMYVTASQGERTGMAVVPSAALVITAK